MFLADSDFEQLQHIGWPGALVVIAAMAFFAFVVWVIAKY